MKVTETKQNIQGGLGETVLQGISRKNQGRATYFLRDKIYSDKLKAAITEPVCNAVDEHRKHNVNRPVDVIICNDEVVIRDYAKGLDKEGMQKVFFQYFESTKSDSDTDIGGFGIGAKAPGAYSDLYYVESYFNSTKTTYMSSVQGYESIASIVYTGPCDSNDTGIAVRIPIKKDEYGKGDHSKISSIVQDLYKMIGFTKTTPEITLYRASGGSYYKDNGDTCHYPSVDDYEGWQKLSEEKKRAAIVKGIYPGDTYAPKDDERSVDRLANLLSDKNKARFFYIPDVCLVMERGHNDWFSYDFFRSNYMAYDGDLCYRISIKDELFHKYNISTYGYQWLFFFKRGEQDVGPAREEITVGPMLDAMIANAFSRVKDEHKEKKNTAFYEYIKDNSIVNAYRFTNNNIPCPLARGIQSFPDDSHIISNFVDLFNTRGRDFDASMELKWSEDSISLPTKWENISSDHNIRLVTNTNRWGRDNHILFLNYHESPTASNGKAHKRLYKKEFNTALMRYMVDHPKLFIDNTVRNSINLGFINSADSKKLEAIKNSLVDKKAKLDYTKYWRRGIDYFTLDDLEPYIPERKKAEKGKSTYGKNYNKEALKDFASGEAIDLSEIKQTVLLSAKDVQQKLNWFVSSYKANIEFANCVRHLTGMKHFAACYAKDLEFWKEQGAMFITDITELQAKVLENVTKLKLTYVGAELINFYKVIFGSDKDAFAAIENTGYYRLVLNRNSSAVARPKNSEISKHKEFATISDKTIVNVISTFFPGFTAGLDSLRCNGFYSAVAKLDEADITTLNLAINACNQNSCMYNPFLSLFENDKDSIAAYRKHVENNLQSRKDAAKAVLTKLITHLRFDLPGLVVVPVSKETKENTNDNK